MLDSCAGLAGVRLLRQLRGNLPAEAAGLEHSSSEGLADG